MSDERRVLRELGEWRPQSILRRFGPAPGTSKQLSHTLVALAVLHGPERVLGLLRRLEAEARKIQPRMLALAETDPLFATTASELGTILKDLNGPRARVANETKGGQPIGMNAQDLQVLSELTRLVITAGELAKRPTPAGVARTRKILESPPAILDALAWAAKLAGGGGGKSGQLAGFEGRTVLVFPDHKIAYDPAPD